MNRKTHTSYKDKNGKHKVDSRKLRFETLERWQATNAKWLDIDTNAPSRGYFNERPVERQD